MGLYCVLAGTEGAKALIADRVFSEKGINKVWARESEDSTMERLAGLYGEVPAKKMNFTTMATEVQRLLLERGHAIDLGTAHQRLYKGESLFTAHPGLDALVRHMKGDGLEWMPDVSFDPLPSRTTYLCYSAWSLAGLAEPLFDALDESCDRLNAATAKIALLMEPQE